MKAPIYDPDGYLIAKRKAQTAAREDTVLSMLAFAVIILAVGMVLGLLVAIGLGRLPLPMVFFPLGLTAGGALIGWVAR